MDTDEIFKLLFNSYFERVYRATCLIVQDELVARDATQEAFVAAFKQLSELKDLDKIYGWLATVASNKAIKMIKKNQLSMPVATIDETKFSPAQIPDSIGRLEKRLDVMQALKMIELKHREVIVLKYYLEFEDKEIAELLGLPLGTVKSRLNRARKALKGILDTEREVI